MPDFQGIKYTIMGHASRSLAEEMRKIVLPMIEQEQLKDALEIVPIKSGNNIIGHSLQIPVYWARYIHDGTKPSTKSKGIYVFFEELSKDPRIRAGVYPTRIEKVKHLQGNNVNSKRSLAYWKKKVKIRERKIYGPKGRKTGQPQVGPIFISTRLPGRPADPFFNKAAALMDTRAVVAKTEIDIKEKLIESIDDVLESSLTLGKIVKKRSTLSRLKKFFLGK